MQSEKQLKKQQLKGSLKNISGDRKPAKRAFELHFQAVE